MEKQKILSIVEKVVHYTILVARFIAAIFGSNNPSTPKTPDPDSGSDTNTETMA